METIGIEEVDTAEAVSWYRVTNAKSGEIYFTPATTNFEAVQQVAKLLREVNPVVLLVEQYS